VKTAIFRGILGLGMVALALAGAIPASADQILGGTSGLSNPSATITFDELGNLQNQAITNQFASYGATFKGFGWDNATYGQAGATGFSGGDLVNGFSPFPTGAMTISFTSQVTGAAFAALDANGTFLIRAYEGGTLVDSITLLIPGIPGIGYIGFQNDSPFDMITISSATNAPLSIDNLQYTVYTPEPGSLLMLAIGLMGLAALATRRNRLPA